LLSNEPLALRDVPLGFIKVLKLLRAILVGSVAHAGLLGSGITVNFSVCVSQLCRRMVGTSEEPSESVVLQTEQGAPALPSTLVLSAREKCSQTEWLLSQLTQYCIDYPEALFLHP
jgi:hypothetical protein